MENIENVYERKYPTISQEKYILSHIQSISNSLNVIFQEDISFGFTKEFEYITTNKEVEDVFNCIRPITLYLQIIRQSIRDKHIEGFKHLITKDQFIKYKEGEFKK